MVQRRGLLIAGSLVFAARGSGAERVVPDNFPSQPPGTVKEMVTVAHGNVARVRELLAIRPALANASWDWGFGDWETALGAASHVGNRDIAEMLLSHGAYPTLFSATMLGQLDVVKAMIAGRPGVQRTLGPHSIPLLAHARAGGPQAKAVFDYLQEIGDAGGLAPADITPEELQKLTGVYTYGDGPSDEIVITLKGKQLNFTRKGATERMIHHVGAGAFRPAGAPAVRIRFGPAGTLTIEDGEVFINARRS